MLEIELIAIAYEWECPCYTRNYETSRKQEITCTGCQATFKTATAITNKDGSYVYRHLPEV